ncbi:response regulator [Paenibacillus sp. GCM10027628]|uniref:response regulator n=1 Tax=Paenibacillus sp. GCM10027628 TaxID=3273413 RepID=UPI0036300DA2
MWNLLVVEDESIVRVGLRYMINWESLDLNWKAEASNGEEALSIMETQQIHIVLTDIRMPGMDGLELAKQIKQRYPGVQVIFLSSYDDFAYAKEALRIGAVDYLHKPTMDEDEIKEVLVKTIKLLKEHKPPSRQQLTGDEKNEYLLSLLDKYTFPSSPFPPELMTDEFKAGCWLTVIRKREDAVAESADSEHLRFVSLLFFIDELVVKDWGGIVFHRHYREIIWIAPHLAKAASTQHVERNKYLERLRKKVLELLNAAVIYSHSSSYDDMIDLPKAYMEALLRLPAKEQSDNLIVRMAKEWVDRQLLDEDITLGKVAADIHVSQSYLSRVFLKEVGENFSDYVIRNKLEYAQKQLRETNKKVYEIASEIGYTNPHYFSKLFKEKFGITPLEYRNQ